MPLPRDGAKIKSTLDSKSKTSISRILYWPYRELGSKSSQVLIPGPTLQQVGPLLALHRVGAKIKPSLDYRSEASNVEPPPGTIESLGQSQAKS